METANTQILASPSDGDFQEGIDALPGEAGRRTTIQCRSARVFERDPAFYHCTDAPSFLFPPPPSALRSLGSAMS